MFGQTHFSDVNRLYARKLLAERCLLAIARHEAGRALERPDKEALKELERLLASVSEVQISMQVGSLTADDASAVQMVLQLLLTAQMVSSLPDMQNYLGGLRQTLARVSGEQKTSPKETGRLTQFLEMVSGSLSQQLDTVSARRPFSPIRVRNNEPFAPSAR